MLVHATNVLWRVYSALERRALRTTHYGFGGDAWTGRYYATLTGYEPLS